MFSFLKNTTLEKEVAELPDDARVWIYQSNRQFTSKEVQEIESLGNQFVSGWEAHGKPLTSTFQVVYSRFIIIGTDENKGVATGCSIDSSVQLIQSIEKRYGVDLMDKMMIGFRDQQNEIDMLPLNEFGAELKSGRLTGETIVFNNIINSWGDLKDKWEVPIKNSWHKQLMES